MLLWMGLALGATCEVVGMDDVLAIPPPAIVVLGERHGTQPDLQRASQVVNRLARRSPVTLAIEAIPVGKQEVLDAYARGEVDPIALPRALGWTESVGFPYKPYQPLVTSPLRGVELVAAGFPPEPPPDDAEFPVPGGYMSVLQDAMGSQGVPLSLQADYIRLVSWQDHRIARRAVEAWDGQGYLVLLADRTRVEGGKGVAWQAGLLRTERVEPFILSWAGDPPCYRGDRVWKRSLVEQLYPATGGQPPET